MSRDHSTLAIHHLLLLLFSPAVLAFRVLQESDNSPTAQFPLTFSGTRSNVDEGLSSRHPLSDHDEVLQPNILFDPLEEFRYALDVMQTTWFEVRLGTWPTAIDWTRAVLDTHLVSSLATLAKIAGHHGRHRSYAINAEEAENEINKYFTQNVSLGQSYCFRNLPMALITFAVHYWYIIVAGTALVS